MSAKNTCSYCGLRIRRCKHIDFIMNHALHKKYPRIFYNDNTLENFIQKNSHFKWSIIEQDQEHKRENEQMLEIQGGEGEINIEKEEMWNN